MVQHTLKALDIDPKRVEMFNLSSAMGPQFAEIASNMTQKVAELGPSPLNASRA